MALIDKASLLFVPSVVAQEKAFNILPSGNRAPDSTGENSGYDQTRADFDFDRGSNAVATRIDENGVLQKYRENLLLQSNQFDTTWTTSNASVTSGQSGYDGTNNAWLLQNNVGFSTAVSVRQSFSLSSSVRSFSVYAKAGSTNWIRILLYDNVTICESWFNLNDGSISNASNIIDAKSTSVGGGWYRCEISANISVALANIYPTNSGGSSTSDSGDNIYIQNAQLESGLVATDVLTSGATTAKAGVLIDLPRIDYSSGAGALLLEPQRVNLISYSEYFGTWTLNSNGTGSDPVLDFGYTSPEGKDNAYKVTLDSGSGTTTSDESIMYLNKSGLTAGSEHTASVYLKGAVGGEEVIVRDTEGSYKKWTLTTEWARYEYTQTAAGSSYATSFGIRQGLGGIGTINSSAVVYIYGFQSELGSYQTSYIPNHGTSGGVTRAADSCSVTGVSDVIGQTEGVVYMDFVAQTSVGQSQSHFWIGVSGSEIGLYGGSSFTFYSSGGVSINGGSMTNGQRYKVAFAYKANDYVAYVNGVQVGADTSASVPTTSAFYLNSYSNGTEVQTKNINQAILFKERLSNAELATLTTL